MGASAGSVEAFTRLLTTLRSDTGMAFVLLSHLSPDHRSELARLLSLRTEMLVRDAVDDTPVAPNHVYVLPPNKTLTIAGGRLYLGERHSHDGHPSTIDQFLLSLAADLGPRAIGVILSGTGWDGTAGLQAIKARGGLTYAEDPLLAAFEGMPRSAERSGAVDFILPIDEIAKALGDLAGLRQDPPPSEAAAGLGVPAELDDGATDIPAPSYSEAELAALEQIITILRTATGVDFHHYKRPSLARRVRHRVDELGGGDFVIYLARLRQDPAEVNALLDTVLIQVTHFFREPGTFKALQSKVLPALLTGVSSGSSLRTWVVGCATGQEAYSVAISFLEVGAALGLEVKTRVFASDLSESGLAKARVGVYSAEECAGLSSAQLKRYFVPVDHGFQVTKPLRGLCVFARHDVTRDPPFAQLDMVFCSNVMIYLDQMLQRRVLQNVHFALKPSGYLVLGPAESTSGVDGLFAPLDGDQKIFLRRNVPAHLHLTAGEAAPSGAAVPRVKLRHILPLQWSTTEIQRAVERVFFTDYVAASVIVSPELDVLHFQGPTAPYLEAPTGGPTVQILRLAHPELRLPLGRMLRRAKKDEAPVRRRGVRLTVDGKPRTVDLSVLPVSVDTADTPHFLVVFERSAGRGGAAQKTHGDSGVPAMRREDVARVLELEGELAENREYLQAVIDQQAATHDELQAAYEASLSVNEEYQSTNEELESTKEEMQSLNEELTTLNEQLQLRHADLQARTAELNNLLEAVDMPMLLLTADLRVRAFNSRAGSDLRLAPSHVGRSIPENHLPLPVWELRQLTDGALRNREVQERELQDPGGRWRALRAWPVQPDGAEGTVAVALVDITKLKEEVATAAAAQAYSEAIVETVLEPLVVLDATLRMVHANRAFHRVFETDAQAIGGVHIHDLAEGAWESPELDGFLERARGAGRPLQGPELTLASKRLGRRTFEIAAGLIGQPGIGTGRLLLAMNDVTGRKTAEAATMEAARMQAVGALAGGVAHEINNQMTAVLGFASLLFQEAGASDGQRRDLTYIVKAAGRSAEITAQLLAFSRQQRMALVVLNLNTLVAASETLLLRVLGPDIVLETLLGEHVGQVRADQGQLEQVLVNLALNARDAMGRAGRLTIETTTVQVTDTVSSEPDTGVVPRGTYARLIVRDTGAGMDRATLARVFEPFFTTKPVGEGTGLGLASVYGTVKQSGGLIWVESEPGRGTTFTIDLPQVDAKVAPKEAKPSAVAAGGTETVLVVEDEEGVREWITRSLQSLGYKVVATSDPAEALRLLVEERARPDLVLSDVIMPGLDGARLLALVSEVRPGLPVILMSGFAVEELVRQGRVAQGTSILHKPFDPATLAAEVRRALDRRGEPS